jgi:LmbE family N-acetylglucosaminyl deacetylase
MTSPTFLFVSPHLDDAVLSCGGLIYRLIQAKHRVIITTVVTTDPPAHTVLSGLAQRNQDSWGLGESPFNARRLEDIKAIKELGAEYIHLGFLDAIYRVDVNQHPLYTKNVVGIPVHSFDWKNYEPALRVALRSILDRYAGETFYVFSPLSLGGHVDHVIVRRAVESAYEGIPIIYFEEYPYAERLGVISHWMNSGARNDQLIPKVVSLTMNEINARITSIANYSSQLRGLFPSGSERILEIARARLKLQKVLRFPGNLNASRTRMDSSLRSYIAKVGGERYWVRKDAADMPNSFTLHHSKNHDLLSASEFIPG